MFKKYLVALLSGLVALVLPACDSDLLQKLRPGVSTVEEVQSIMGRPTMEWRNSDGSITLEYARTPQGTVNYMMDFGSDRILKVVRQVLTEENFAKVKEGMSRDEVRRLLGQAASEEYYSLKKEYVWDWKTKEESGTRYFFDVYFNEAGLVTRTGSHYKPINQ